MFLSFDYLTKEFPRFVKLGQLAEIYCDPYQKVALYKIRKIGETITVFIHGYDNCSVKVLPEDTLLEKERIIKSTTEQVLEQKYLLEKFILVRIFRGEL